MKLSIQTPLPGRRTMALAIFALAIGLASAFAAAWLSRDVSIFSLAPAPGKPPDMLASQRLDLHRTFFTIWAALLLVTPALCLFPFRRRSELAARYWLAFWTVALVAFCVHFYWAVVVIFGNDWKRIMSTPRVSAPVLDTVFALWWCADVAIAWLIRSEATWVRVERTLVHVLAFVLFFMGAAREGELLASRFLGWTMAGLVAAALAAWLARLRKSRGSINVASQ